MDILVNWLNKNVKLSEKIVDVESQFSNGFLFGEILHKYNQILDFENTFKNKDTKMSIVKNFAAIEPVMRRLGVKFNLNIALKIKNTEQEAAVCLLRVLKDALEKTQGILDIQILKKTGQKNKIFPLKKIDFSKSKYEKIQNKIFFTRLYNMILPQQEDDLQKKLKKFTQVKIKHR